MIRLNVININEFLQTVNECVGAVKMIDSNGIKYNINRQDDIQSELRRRHRENREFLRLVLEIPEPADYMKLVFFTIGDC